VTTAPKVRDVKTFIVLLSYIIQTNAITYESIISKGIPAPPDVIMVRHDTVATQRSKTIDNMLVFLYEYNVDHTIAMTNPTGVLVNCTRPAVPKLLNVE
jgi:hypothetical protein